MFVITEWQITLTRHQLFLTHVHSLINNLLANFHRITIFGNSFMTFMIWSRPVGPWNEHWSWALEHVFSYFFQNVTYSYMYVHCICLPQCSTKFISIWYTLYFLQKLGLVCLPKEYNCIGPRFEMLSPNYLEEFSPLIWYSKFLRKYYDYLWFSIYSIVPIYIYE